ncbi:acylphosphatase-1-like isoform X2 [Coccinella septempunctata]|uniref:acylphosphatase-1-like isoform X2 n=1 Tax=Coccinella septempunctata TaxID=41139 RepID=UPI001D05EF0B|nr:acylphosphatase-1-like isoform X2 [Coccinella septempunctata]
MASSSRLISVDFEVYGHVQAHTKGGERTQPEGVLHEHQTRNCQRNVARRYRQSKHDVSERKRKVWLQKTGSPKSKIEKAEFSNEKQITSPSFNDFAIKKFGNFHF